MKILKLAAAAALAVSSLAIGVAPAAADQRGDNMEQRGDMRHDGMRGDNGRHDSMRGDRGRYGANSRYNHGRHNSWNNNRGRHNGWRRQRVCQTVWRHHRPVRHCYWVNRRWR